MKQGILIISLVIFSVFSFVICQGQTPYKVSKIVGGVVVTTQKGTLSILPLTDDAVRIQYGMASLKALPELVFVSKIKTPDFKVVENASSVAVKLKKMTVVFDKQAEKLSYTNAAGETFLSETPNSRVLKADSIKGEACYLAQQSFFSAPDEYLFGLGQFQDGNYKLRGIARQLTQVNSQIAIPFMYSNKGYGLLWHQYGLTDFNPADNKISLGKIEQAGGTQNLVEVTTTAGTQKVSQDQSIYKGKFAVPSDGSYSIFLNLGAMGNRHFVTIDGVPCLDQSNMWLPPTAGTLVNLKAGEHEVQLICKSDNKPELSWKLSDNTTTFRSPVATKIDYVVFYGPSAENVIATYRNLSGNAPLFPKWAYGFWQCRERYSSGQQLVETVEEFRKRQLPLDAIVQDWQYWGNRGWGVPQFDETHYPNPAGFIKQLHDQNAHFNISIWSNPDKNSEIGKEYVARDRFIPGTKWLDYFNPATRKEYWNTLKINMFDNGVDSWWMDAVEPENDALKGERTFIGLGDFYRLTYPLMVSQAVAEGQREASAEKRVCILTRSAFLGQQRYGIINWSGDIGGNWDTYQRQIVAGLHYTITGMPYWTTDIGGFFRPGPKQYTDENYHELLTRWFQWGAFNPIFRVHGYMSETEPWKYGATVETHIRHILQLRYQLISYIYSDAWQITHNGSTMMRPLVMDFRDDSTAVSQAYEFMFGASFLVAPVTKAGVHETQVYLPKSTPWYNFWSEKYYNGGQTVSTQAPLHQIPLFVKAGAIIPLNKPMQYATQSNCDTLNIKVYEGANGEFTLYEDENDNYNYEKNAYSTISFTWNDAQQTLSIGNRQGTFPGMSTNRQFIVEFVSKNNTKESKAILTVGYKGKKLNIRKK